MNLYSYYESVLEDVELSMVRYSTGEKYNLDMVFDYPSSYNYIFETLWDSSETRPLAKTIAGLYRKNLNADLKDRLCHSISLYFMGIAIAERIGYEHFNLPKWDMDAKKNFLHHWSAICCFHDIGYVIESKEDIAPYCTLDALVNTLGLTYRLDLENDSELIREYYRYRVDICGRADHGIVGAMILYNSLMASYKKKDEIVQSGAVVFSGKPIVGKQILEGITLFCQSIARHNMWYKDYSGYPDYQLDDLTMKDDNSHCIKFSKSPMLYLLCLVDTIEPLKVNKYHNPLDILRHSELDVTSSDSSIDLRIHSESGLMEEKASGLATWIDVLFDQSSGILTIQTEEL